MPGCLTPVSAPQVISAVRQTVSDLRLAIEGTIIMSQTLREALDAMYDARVPSRWHKVGPGRFRSLVGSSDGIGYREGCWGEKVTDARRLVLSD